MTKKNLIAIELMENGVNTERAYELASELAKAPMMPKTKKIDPNSERKSNDAATRKEVSVALADYKSDKKHDLPTFCGTLLGNWERLAPIFAKWNEKALEAKTVEDIIALIPECMYTNGSVCIWGRTKNPNFVPAEKTKSGKVKKAAVGKPTLPCFTAVENWDETKFAKVLYQGCVLEGKCATFAAYLKCEAEAAKVNA